VASRQQSLQDLHSGARASRSSGHHSLLQLCVGGTPASCPPGSVHRRLVQRSVGPRAPSSGAQSGRCESRQGARRAVGGRYLSSFALVCSAVARTLAKWAMQHRRLSHQPRTERSHAWPMKLSGAAICRGSGAISPMTLCGKRPTRCRAAASSMAATRSSSSRVERWEGRQASCFTCSRW
jgi:hypothetical protein